MGIGTRFKCFECPDYDLCQECEKTEHKHHIMLRIPEPKNLTNLLQSQNERVIELNINNIPHPSNVNQPEFSNFSRTESEIIPECNSTQPTEQCQSQSESQQMNFSEVLEDLVQFSEHKSKEEF